MTTRTRSRLYVSMAAMMLTAALAVPAGAQTSCAGLAAECFKGTFQGEDAHVTLSPGATSVVISTTATGTGTHLGQFSLIREITGNLTNFTDTGSAHWIAANRDSITWSTLRARRPRAQREAPKNTRKDRSRSRKPEAT